MTKLKLDINLLTLGLICLSGSTFGMSNTNLAEVSDYDKPFKVQNAEMTFKLGSVTQDSELNSANIMRTSFGLSFDKEIHKGINFSFDGNLFAERGSADSLFNNNSYVPDDGINLKKAELNYKPFEALSLGAGSISLKEFNNPFLISNTSFLGSVQRLEYKNGPLSFTLRALQATPNNRNLSNRLDRVNEENPSFFLESFQTSFDSERVIGDLTLSRFAYANLSNSVAAQSGLRGNSVNFETAQSGEFVYSYIGNASRLMLGAKLGNTELKGVINSVLNEAAPESNEALLTSLRLETQIKDIKISFFASDYTIESDAYVAFYASNIFKPNTKGQGFGLDLEDLRSKLQLEVRAYGAQEIQVNQLVDRDREDIVYVGVKRVYEL